MFGRMGAHGLAERASSLLTLAGVAGGVMCEAGSVTVRSRVGGGGEESLALFMGVDGGVVVWAAEFIMVVKVDTPAYSHPLKYPTTTFKSSRQPPWASVVPPHGDPTPSSF